MARVKRAARAGGDGRQTAADYGDTDVQEVAVFRITKSGVITPDEIKVYPGSVVVCVPYPPWEVITPKDPKRSIVADKKRLHFNTINVTPNRVAFAQVLPLEQGETYVRVKVTSMDARKRRGRNAAAVLIVERTRNTPGRKRRAPKRQSKRRADAGRTPARKATKATTKAKARRAPSR